jgi:hypothetical protein
MASLPEVRKDGARSRGGRAQRRRGVCAVQDPTRLSVQLSDPSSSPVGPADAAGVVAGEQDRPDHRPHKVLSLLRPCCCEASPCSEGRMRWVSAHASSPSVASLSTDVAPAHALASATCVFICEQRFSLSRCLSLHSLAHILLDNPHATRKPPPTLHSLVHILLDNPHATRKPPPTLHSLAHILLDNPHATRKPHPRTEFFALFGIFA